MSEKMCPKWPGATCEPETSCEHAGLCSDLKRQVIALSTIIKINNIIGFLPIGLDEILNAVTSEANRLFAPWVCRINLRDDPLGARPHLDPATCLVFRHGLPLVIGDVQRDQCCTIGQNDPQVKSYVCLPITDGREVLGTLTLNSPVPNAISRADLEILLSLANQTALAVQRAKLFQRVEEEKRQLQKANEELKETQGQLIQTEKMAAAGRLAADVAHEINNPTGIILSRIDCLLCEAAERGFSEDLVRDLEVIQRHAQRITQTTRSLLSFARLPVSRPAPIDVNQVVEETLSFLSYRLSRQHIDVVRKLDPDLPAVMGNDNQVQQVLFNLLENARDAMPEGGTITIASQMSPEGYVQVVVSDTGIGIRPEDLNRIFDPYFTTKEVGQGTGLGLSICLAIIKEHGGSISAESTLGGGASFTISLPLSR